MSVGGLATLRKLSKTTPASYTYVFLTQYFVAPTGHVQAPHGAPIWRSPHTATFAPLGNLGRKWLHTQRMSPHRQTTTPFNCGSEVGGVTGECECRRVHECVCVRFVQRATSDQRSTANSLNDSYFRVRVILRNVRHVWLSVHMCFVLFFHEMRLRMCVCVHTRAGHAGGDIWHDGNSFDHPAMHCVTRGVYVSFKVMHDLFVVMATLTEDRGRPLPSCNEIITGRYLA